TSSNTTLEMLGDTMSYVAPVASALGISIEEVAAMTGRLGDVGIQGQRAGTSLRAILSRLAALAKPTGEAQQLVKELGISITDAAGNMLPLVDILRQVEQRTASMGSAERAAYLTRLVGMEAVSAFSALLDVGADNIAAYTEQLRNSAGVAQEVASRQLDNLKGALKVL